MNWYRVGRGKKNALDADSSRDIIEIQSRGREEQLVFAEEAIQGEGRVSIAPAEFSQPSPRSKNKA